MQNNLDKHTLKIKSKLNTKYLSPLFIRLANLLYANEHYEECIFVCKTGLIIYPRYLTAKLILLKAFLKAEYLNEAEILFKEIKSKITDKGLLSRIESNMKTLKTVSKQEKIYYSRESKSKIDYKSFEKNFHYQENLFTEFDLNDLFSEAVHDRLLPDKDFKNFLSIFEEFHFEKVKDERPGVPAQSMSDVNDDFLGRIKIVTETLADIYAEQGNYKEAFDAYNLLLRAGSRNSRRIEEKINELERNLSRDDMI